MNKIYKVLKSKSTGAIVVAGEFAKGAKKGSRLQLTTLAFLGLFAQQSLAATIMDTQFNPKDNSNKTGSTEVSTSGNIDLNGDWNFSNADKGNEVKKHTITTGAALQALYQTKYVAVAKAQAAYDNAVENEAEQSVIDNYRNELQTAQDTADAITSLTVKDPNNIIGSNNMVTTIEDKELNYADPVTDAIFNITVIDTFTETTAKNSLGNSSIAVDFYEKEDEQYDEMEVVKITGSSTEVTIVNTALPDSNNNKLSVVAKNGSGVITVVDGANLTFDTDVSYYLGGDKSVSQPFDEDKDYSSSSSTTLYEVSYAGTIDTILGERTINSADDLNEFNKELIEYIKTNGQIQLDCPSESEMQAFYDEQISLAYDYYEMGTYEVTYTVTAAEIAALAIEQGLEEEFEEKVTTDDIGTDIGLAPTNNNHFINISGDGSTITINNGVTIDNSVDGDVSDGTVIKADGSNHTFNIDGTINANGRQAISANDAKIYVSEKGKIVGHVTVGSNNENNIVENKGSIKGNIYVETGTIANGGKIVGNVTGGDGIIIDNMVNATMTGIVSAGDDSTITNTGTIWWHGDDQSTISTGSNAIVHNMGVIVGDVDTGQDSTVKNESFINGIVTVTGNEASFTNKGSVSGVQALYEAKVVNEGLIVGTGVVTLSDKSELTNQGDIYVGYIIDETQSPTIDSINDAGYTAMSISGTGTWLANETNIYVSGSQHDVTAVSVSEGGKYSDNEGSVIELTGEGIPDSGLNQQRGHDNIAVYVTGEDSTATIAGTVKVNDIGSTALWADEGGEITLSGTVELFGQNIPKDSADDIAVRNFGAWVSGTGTKFIMNDDAQINMNADRAIGVHIRDGATAEINDSASITFSDDKTNQIGFLISGISNASSIIYNSEQALTLQGDGSVLFRVERGSKFDTNTLAGATSLSVLDSNDTKDSTLIVITNGPVATGANNQTTADLSGFTLKVSGEEATGIRVEGGAEATITEDTAIQLTGNGAILAQVDGWYYNLNGEHASSSDGNSTLKSDANLTTNSGSEQYISAENAVGYLLTHGGKLEHTGTIDFDEPSQNNIGVKIESGGKLISEAGSYIKVHGTAVEISGSASSATIKNVNNGDSPVVWAIGAADNNSDAAYHVKDSANLTLTGSGVTKAQGTAHGILVDGASRITLNGAVLDLYGDGSANSSSGNGIENRSALNNISFNNNARIDVLDGYGIHSSVGFSQSAQTSGVINVYGSGTGIRFEGIDTDTGEVSGSTDNKIENTGYEKVVINVYEQDGHGIYVDSNKDANVSASVNIISNDGQSALEIKGTTSIVSQSGNLHSANQNAVIVDLNNGYTTKFTNNGELLFGEFDADNNFTATDKADATNAYAIQTVDNENGLIFTNGTKGNINGVVELLGHGNNADHSNIGNTVILSGKGNIFRTGEGEDTFIVNQVSGDDLGGANQVKQFTQLDGGDGDDSITFNNRSDFTINNDSTITDIEYFALDNESQVTLNKLTTVDGLNTGVTVYDIIDSKSVLTYKWANSNTNFDRLLNGEGIFKVDLENGLGLGKNGDFAFDTTTNTGDFEGTLALTNTNYILSDSADSLNTEALTNATLQTLDNSYVKVGEGDQHIGGLDISGGTIDFGHIELSEDKSANHIVVDQLALEKGNIQIDVSGSIYNPSIPTSLSILEQDSGIVFTKLVSANNISGSASNLDIDREKIKLIDEEGNEITDPTQTHLIQNSDEVARATYDTRFSKGENSDGLYVGYGLTQIELKTKNDINGDGNALILDATDSDSAKAGSSDLDALITDYDNGDGTYTYGDLQIRGSKAVTLSASNTYHGSTFVKDSSTLVAGADNALGFTRLLQLDSGTAFNLNSHAQTVGSLYTTDNAVVDLNDGELTISGEDGTDSTVDLNSYVVGGTLTGSGKLIIGDTTLTRATTHSPILTVNGDNPELTAQVINMVNGEININSQGGLGSGELTNNGVLNVYLADAAELTNDSLIGNGVLNKYNAGTLTFTLEQAQDYSGETNINSGAIIFKGDDNVTDNGYATRNINIADSATLIGIDHAIFQGNINNSGHLFIGELPESTTVSQSTVTVNNYTGNTDSYLMFNGTLSDDDSPIGKLIINGDSTGTSYVTVNNIGGQGAHTINGIEIISVEGQSDAEFVQSGRIIAGAYDYKLQRSEVDNNNWVLFSNLTARSEVGGYLSNIFAANNLFNLRLHDRLGETQYTDLLTGEHGVTSMWMRHQYGYDKFQAANGDLAVKNNWNITQIGGDIAQWSSDELNRLHIGLMVGYGRSSGKSSSTIDGAKAESVLDGYSYGIYATWYDNDRDKTGLYIDTWALWNNFNASVSGKDFSEKYRLKGLTASVETGYSLLTGTLGNYDVWLQPKGQLIWGNVKTKDRIESNGTRISTDNGNIQTRLGARISLLSNAMMQAQTNQSGQLFMEANWLHNTKLYNVTLNDELTISQDGARNIGELKIGLEGNISKNTNLWFNLAGQRGDHHYKNAAIMLGLKYSF